MKQGFIALAMAVIAAPLAAQDVVFLGETHDNPGHHVQQAKRVAALSPKALVFEMLTEAKASRITPELRADQKAMRDALEWDRSGWPNFSMYYPIFAAAPEAAIFGAAVPRDDVRRLMSEPVEAVFGADAEGFGLTKSLPEEQQAEREAMQMAAHCDALPAEMLPMMVNMQRLRDAALARAVLGAFEQTGGPVAVITGNGHARKDWGAPAILALAAPELDLFSLGQGEEGAGAPEGGFDEIVFSPPAKREDPCNAFK
ncbi:ChaN family lipoprotein [Tropicibacter sp. R15_0]|uniref:ChaN family lipoprotein n=1 Tax=Tropicibacter sp. R15_0 TaxID=2821101 RepID=UPI001ADA07D0|nr:ChaN family lipoprotein [Tropicibacter sp. R15_0]MBO9466923.1 ChaN family lipoprotein [Tropicibacter sp. R15_0]